MALIQIVDSIKNLEKIEYDSLTAINNSIEGNMIPGIENEKVLAKYCQLADNKGVPNLFASGPNSHWSNTVDKISILRQLLHKDHLIIDLIPLKNNDDCIKKYGLTVGQLALLAYHGKVAINLYAYESNKNKNFIEYTLFEGNRNEVRNYLSLFQYTNRMRINSLRRRFFNEKLLLDKNINYYNLFLEGKDKIKSIIKSDQILNDIIKKNLIRSESLKGDNPLDGAIESLAQHYAEVSAQIMLKGDDNAQILLNIFNQKTIVPTTAIAVLRALRVLTVSPLSASLGSHYTMSSVSASSIQAANQALVGIYKDEFNSLRNKKNTEKYLDSKPLASLKNIVEDYVLTNNLTSKPLDEVPEYLNDYNFDEYLKFVEANKMYISKQTNFIEHLSKLKTYNDEDNIKLLKEFLQSQNDLGKKYASEKSFRSNSIKIFNVFVCFFINDFLKNSSTGLQLVGLIPGITLEYFNEQLSALIMEGNSQIMLDANSLKNMYSTLN